MAKSYHVYVVQFCSPSGVHDVKLMGASELDELRCSEYTENSGYPNEYLHKDHPELRITVLAILVTH